MSNLQNQGSGEDINTNTQQYYMYYFLLCPPPLFLSLTSRYVTHQSPTQDTAHSGHPVCDHHTFFCAHIFTIYFFTHVLSSFSLKIDSCTVFLYEEREALLSFLLSIFPSGRQKKISLSSWISPILL